MAPFRLPSSILAETAAASFASGSFEGRRVCLLLVVEILVASLGGKSGKDAVRDLMRLVKFCRLPSRGGTERILVPNSSRFCQATRSPGVEVARRRIEESSVQQADLAERGICLSSGPDGRVNVKGGVL